MLLGYRQQDLPDFVAFYAHDVDDQLVERVAPWIKRLPSITTIDLSGTGVTSACCQTLAGIPHLREVWLEDTRLGDGDIQSLGRLHQIEELWIDGAPLSAAGVRELQGLLPRCEIQHGELWGS